MDMSRSILSPFGKAKRISSAAMDQLSDLDTETIRDHVTATAKQIAGSARDAAVAATEAAVPYLHKVANASQQQLQSLGDTLEANARQMAVRLSSKRNVITRHPIAATLLAGSLGYLAMRAWQRSHADSANGKSQTTTRKRAAARKSTNAATRSEGVRTSRASNGRSTREN